MNPNSWKTTTRPRARRYGVAAFLGIITGIVSAMVKSGSEGIMPPRTPDRIAPPIEMINDMGMQAKEMVYTYSDHIVNWGGAGIHYLFSIVFAMLYCILAEIYPKVKLWQGIAFGILVAVFSHGILLPALDLSPMPWDLPFDEILSEFVGTSIWMWVIEIFRHDLRQRITGEPDPEYYV